MSRSRPDSCLLFLATVHPTLRGKEVAPRRKGKRRLQTSLLCALSGLCDYVFLNLCKSAALGIVDHHGVLGCVVGARTGLLLKVSRHKQSSRSWLSQRETETQRVAKRWDALVQLLLLLTRLRLLACFVRFRKRRRRWCACLVLLDLVSKNLFLLHAAAV